MPAAGDRSAFGLYGPVEDIPLDDARYQFEVNLFGLARLTQIVLPHMRAQRSGRIINTSSMGGRVFLPYGACYHATKHALEGWFGQGSVRVRREWAKQSYASSTDARRASRTAGT